MQLHGDTRRVRVGSWPERRRRMWVDGKELLGRVASEFLGDGDAPRGRVRG